jgi:uncharacterized RDD family membrane protein YckC/DNA-directed RNA polymerase subunit RPC12/RpoP
MITTTIPKSNYQSVGIRFAATLIDGIILFVVISIASFVIYILVEGRPIEDSPKGALMMTFIWIFFPLAYYTILEGVKGATIGKKLCGIHVEKVDGTPCDIPSAIVRNLLRFIDGFFGYLVGAIIIWNSDKKQRLGDMVAKTVVVMNKTNIGSQEEVDAKFVDRPVSVADESIKHDDKTSNKKDEESMFEVLELLEIIKKKGSLSDKEKIEALKKSCFNFLERLESNPSNGVAHFGLGTIAMMLNDWDDAMKELELALQDDSNEWYRAYNEKAHELLNDARQEKRQSSVKQAIDAQIKFRMFKMAYDKEKKEKVSPEKIGDKSLNKIYKCVRCEKEFESKNNIIEYPGNQLVCKQCDAELDRGVMQDFKFVTHIPGEESKK